MSCCLALALVDAVGARAETVTLAELQGAAIEATVVYQQQTRREGRTFSIRLQNDYRFTVGSGDSVQYQITNTVEGQYGERSRTRSGSARLKQAGQTRALGGGDSIWLFANGHLTFLRTFRSGGRMIDVTFSRSGDRGWQCRALRC